MSLEGMQMSHAGHLYMAAAKSRYGHAETAAGCIGMLAGIRELTHAEAQPIMHLRTVNPMVGEALQQAGKQQMAGGSPCSCLDDQAYCLALPLLTAGLVQVPCHHNDYAGSSWTQPVLVGRTRLHPARWRPCTAQGF